MHDEYIHDIYFILTTVQLVVTWAFTDYVRPYWNMLRAFGPHIRWGKSNKLNMFKEVSPDSCYIIHVLIIKTSFEIRRLRQDLIYTYKFVFGLVTNAGNEFFTLANSVNANISTRGHMYKLFQHHSRIDARKYFFTERVVRVWNGLPAEQRHFSSLIQFKNFINSVDLSIYVSLGF